jgi:hypothetical protein
MFKREDVVSVRSGKVKVKAKVVWKGESREHGCAGVGLMLL